jgi:hypothetical protein
VTRSELPDCSSDLSTVRWLVTNLFLAIREGIEIESRAQIKLDFVPLRRLKRVGS